MKYFKSGSDNQIYKFTREWKFLKNETFTNDDEMCQGFVKRNMGVGLITIVANVFNVQSLQTMAGLHQENKRGSKVRPQIAF